MSHIDGHRIPAWCADLPSSWRLTSTRTHSLPRTLVFRGFTSHHLGSTGLTLGPPVGHSFYDEPWTPANCHVSHTCFTSSPHSLATCLGAGVKVSKKQHEQTSTRLPVVRVRRKRGGKRREQKSGSRAVC